LAKSSHMSLGRFDCGLRYSTASGSERVNLRDTRIKGQAGRYRSLYCINPQSAIRNPQSVLLFGCLGLLGDVVLLANHDLPVNPRYLLTGLLGLAAICGWCLAELVKCYRVWAAPLLIGFVIITKGTYNHMAKELYDQEWSALATKRYISKIETLPWNSAFIVGARTPLINLYYWVGARPYWKTISPGSGWPDDKLNLAIDDLLIAGRVVYVDFDPELWQLGLRAENREGPGLEMIKREYKLEHLHDSFYRIVEKIP